MISQEELDLYRKHQKLFREKMRKVQEGDRYLAEETDPESILVTCKLCDTNEDGEWLKYFNTAILLPLPIDPVNPERGLWGMIDWHKFSMTVDGPEVMTFQWDAIDEKTIWSSGYCSPTLAILRAIDAQEEGK